MVQYGMTNTPMEKANLRLTAILKEAKERGKRSVYAEMAERIEARHKARADAMIEEAIPS